MKRLVLCLSASMVLVLSYVPGANAQFDTLTPIRQHYSHSLDFSPLSPLFGIYALQYTYKLTESSSIIAGPLYMRIVYKNVGNTDAPGFLLGYRHYLWKQLHVEYQLMAGWDRFYEQNEKKRYQGFDLWNELRVGYVWDFELGAIPAFVTVQWPFGFALYSDSKGKPESFKQLVKDDPFFYFPPFFFLGVRF